jgi:hypothetical protein
MPKSIEHSVTSKKYIENKRYLRATVKIPVSSLVYVLDLLVEIEFNVI